jgi:hypothetical protein
MAVFVLMAKFKGVSERRKGDGRKSEAQGRGSEQARIWVVEAEKQGDDQWRGGTGMG